MKLKSAPEDFCVDELTDVRCSGGAHALYSLRKKGIGTPEAVQEILHQWNLPRHALSYGGLKDRHAVTTQHVSIRGGPRSGIEERSFQLEYLGQVARPFVASDIRGNRFRIRLRGLNRSQRSEFESRIAVTHSHGLVNYFDDQRFGSIGVSGDLIGAAWCKGNYERALYLALAEPNSHDRPREKVQKEILRNRWGDWENCKKELDRSHRRSVVTYLVDHPTDFKRALALVRQDLRGIYAAAFQSWVWNRWLSSLIEERLGGPWVNRMPSRSGGLAVPARLNGEMATEWDDFVSTSLPLPSARIHQWPEGTLPALEKVLESLSMTVREMRFKYPRDTFFSKGMRSVRLVPEELSWSWETADDALERNDWVLGFTLPRGCYATMAIRQWTLDAGALEESDEADGNHAEDE
ncbi:MAG: tRNA pseudouridine(13) synthase TruD [Planctomycetota bacterium]|jgi:tRNA pseudouridine13 synthase